MMRVCILRGGEGEGELGGVRERSVADTIDGVRLAHFCMAWRISTAIQTYIYGTTIHRSVKIPPVRRINRENATILPVYASALLFLHTAPRHAVTHSHAW